MFKKTLISLAVASSLGLTGCFDSANDGANANPSPKYAGDAINATYPLFNPAKRQIPTPTDLSFVGSLDGTFNIELNDDSSPVEIALDSLSGASTVDPIIIKTNGQIDETSLKPNENIFLIPLQYASGDPVQGLSNQEPPQVDQAKVAKTSFSADVIEVDGVTAIRIVPLEPLVPNTRYVIGITNGVKDATGKPIGQDPVYANITGAGTDEDPNFGLVNDALAGIRTLTNKLWEPIVTGFAPVISGGKAKPAAEDVALSYSMTTSNDVTVLSYIANPELWLRDQVKNFVRVSIAKKVVGAALFAAGTDLRQPEPSPVTGYQKWDLNRDGEIDARDFDANMDGKFDASDFLWANTDPKKFGFDDVDEAVQFVLDNFKPSRDLKDARLAFCDAPDGNGEYNLSGLGLENETEQFACVAAALAFLIDTQIPEGMEIAVPDSRDINLGTSTLALQRSAVLASISGSQLVSVNESSIKLPYHLGRPTAQDGSPIQTESWKADENFAKVLNLAFADAGLVLPQGKELSDVVNSIFPFPASSGDIEVPMLIIHPTSQTLSAGIIDDVVIFQHGITTDRSAALAFGSALVAAGQTLPEQRNIAVVAIDQPLHGVAPSTRQDRIDLSETLLTTAALRAQGVAADVEPTDAQQEIAEGFAESFAPALATDLATYEAALQGVPDDSPIKPLAVGLSSEAQADTRALFAATVAKAGSTIPGLAPSFENAGINAEGITERHFGWGSNPDYDRTLDVGPGNLPWAPMQFNPADDVEEPGASGDLFINLGNFLNSRDNLRQGSLDLLNLRASLHDVEKNPDIAAFEGATFHFVGHSLGTINGNAFVMAANASGREDLAIANSHLIAPASGIVRMLENSPSFAPTILAGLNQQAGLTQRNANLQSFFGVLQAAIDTVDPINYAEAMQGSRTLISQIDGDRTTINAAFDFYITEAAEDGFDTQWPAGYKPLQVGIANLTINSHESPLAGSEALAALSDVDITRYAEGTHGTPVLPREEKAEAPNLADFEFEFLKDRTLASGGEVIVSADDAKVTFGGLVGATLSMILTTP